MRTSILAIALLFAAARISAAEPPAPMAADGSDADNLTEAHAGNDAYPSFSPDGRWIAFDSDREQANEIYVMAADGSGPRRITTSPRGNLAPLWVHATETAK